MAHHIPTIDWSSQDIGEALCLYKQKMKLYLEDENIDDAAVKVRKIMRDIGDEGLNVNGLIDDQKKIPTDLWTFFERQWLRVRES